MNLLQKLKKEKRTEEPAMSSNGEGKFYSPLVLNIAQKEGIGIAELEKITGTGVGGRVSKKDILNYLQTRSSKPVSSTTTTTATPVKQPEPQTQKLNQKPLPQKRKRSNCQNNRLIIMKRTFGHGV
ncbi:MAG: E3 binding domain-containing protein [Ignavibacteria bacterium]